MCPGDTTRRAPTDLVRTIEANEAEFLLALGRAGRGEERCDDHLHWTIGGSPIAYHNCVVHAELPADRADAAIVASREVMRRLGVPGSWHVGPSMRPEDLGDRLRAHGFEGSPEPGMAADLETIPEGVPVTGLSVDLVRSEADLDAYEHVLALGFGEGPTEARWVRQMYTRIGLGDDVPWRHYLGRMDGQVVATASLFLAAGVAGIYFACTLPEMRGRGIGTEITRAAMLGARDLGSPTAVLGSSPMGHRIYERLGFRDLCTVEVYEWSPA